MGSAGRELVFEQVGGSNFHRVADLNRHVIRVICGSQHCQYGNAWFEFQLPPFFGSGHSGCDLLGEVTEYVAILFQSGVDAPGPSVHLLDPRAFGESSRDEGDRRFNRSAIRQVAARSHDDVIVR
ncbi:hypothetical protein A5693_06195 [Mycobacterium sp. E1319]|nr:hypothetical protein A5693_06195 [Mycobacterium sp. E1319]